MNNQIEKRLVRSMLDFLELKLIDQGQNYGYALLKAFKKKFGVNLAMSQVYPALYQLEEIGYVKGQWDLSDKPKKVYSITPQGKAYLTKFEQAKSLLNSL